MGSVSLQVTTSVILLLLYILGLLDHHLVIVLANFKFYAQLKVRQHYRSETLSG